MALAKEKFTIFALLLVVAFLAVPSVSAKEGSGYTIRPSISDAPDMTMRLGDSIIQGETNRHQFYVGSGVEYLEVYHDWDSSSDSLTLTIYSPSWEEIGTFHDIADGSMDGKIHIDIVPDSGYADQGTWTFDVYGERVSSQRTYVLNLGQH